MEQITPQYKRGKYIRRRSRKRAKKIVVICLSVAVVLSAAALLFFFRSRIFGGEDAAPVPTDENGVPVSTAETENDEPGKATEATGKPTETTEAIVSGSEVTIADGKLLLTYDSDALTLIEDTELTTLLEKASGAQTPRMDLQKLPSKLGMLRDSELERIAIGLMQAYYYHPQHTEDVDLTVLRNDKQEFAAVMQVPSIDDAPAAVCSVRLMAVGDELWAAVLLQPEGTENAALTSAFQGLKPAEENG